MLFLSVLLDIRLPNLLAVDAIFAISFVVLHRSNAVLNVLVLLIVFFKRPLTKDTSVVIAKIAVSATTAIRHAATILRPVRTTLGREAN